MPGWRYRQARCAVCDAPGLFNGPVGERLCALHSEEAWGRLDRSDVLDGSALLDVSGVLDVPELSDD